MGFFDMVGKAVNRASEMAMEAEAECERISTDEICDKIRQLQHDAGKMPALSACAKVLRGRFEKMDEWELKYFRDKLFNDRNAYAYNVLKQVCQSRGLIN